MDLSFDQVLGLLNSGVSPWMIYAIVGVYAVYRLSKLVWAAGGKLISFVGFGVKSPFYMLATVFLSGSSLLGYSCSSFESSPPNQNNQKAYIVNRLVNEKNVSFEEAVEVANKQCNEDQKKKEEISTQNHNSEIRQYGIPSPFRGASLALGIGMIIVGCAGFIYKVTS